MIFAGSTSPVSLETSAEMVGGSEGSAGWAKTMPPYDVLMLSLTCQPAGNGRLMVGEPGSPRWTGVSVMWLSLT